MFNHLSNHEYKNNKFVPDYLYHVRCLVVGFIVHARYVLDDQ